MEPEWIRTAERQLGNPCSWGALMVLLVLLLCFWIACHRFHPLGVLFCSRTTWAAPEHQEAHGGNLDFLQQRCWRVCAAPMKAEGRHGMCQPGLYQCVVCSSLVALVWKPFSLQQYCMQRLCSSLRLPPCLFLPASNKTLFLLASLYLHPTAQQLHRSSTVHMGLLFCLHFASQ